jgi:replicative DNA helicase
VNTYFLVWRSSYGNILAMANQPSSPRIPPQNLDAETALLGSIMLRPDAIHEVMDIISKNSFYSKKHKTIFEAMLDLFKKNSPIDLLSLSSRLTEKNLLKEVGGNSYLTELVNTVPTAANVRHYAEIVQKKYMMRSLIEASEMIANLGYEEAEDLEEILDRAEKKIFNITSSGNTYRFAEIKDELEAAWDRLDRLQNSQNDLRGVPTGFADIDHKLAGLQNSDLVILAARPSMGKTSLALDIARQTAVTHNNPVGIFSLEMSSQQLVDRMLSAQASVDAWKLRTGKLSREEDFTSIRHALDKLSQAPIFIDDQPGNNILKMKAVARRLKSEKGLKLIIVDYLQLMLPTSTKANDNLVQQVTEISRSLKNLARELDIPVLALSQLSRAVESRGGRPRLSDLRDSGSIEQDADVVMFIHREDKYKDESDRTNIAEILIEKHRNGETGKVELYFNDKKATFQNIDKSNYGKIEEEFEKF